MSGALTNNLYGGQCVDDWRDALRYPLFACSPARAALGRHARVVLEHHVAVVVEVEQRERGEHVRHAARRRHLRVAADRVHNALDRGVIRRIQLLFNEKKTSSVSISK